MKILSIDIIGVAVTLNTLDGQVMRCRNPLTLKQLTELCARG